MFNLEGRVRKSKVYQNMMYCQLQNEVRVTINNDIDLKILASHIGKIDELDL